MLSTTFEIIVLLTIINGLFAMSEVALLSARRVRLQHSAERGDAGARLALGLLQDANNFLATVQIGITLVGILSGAFAGATIAEKIAAYLQGYPAIAPYGETIGIAIVVLGVTYLSLILGELVPKRLALHNPERVATAVAGPMSLISTLAAPAVRILSASTNAVLRLFALREPNEPPVTEEEVKALLRQGAQTGVFDPMEQQIVERVFQFADRRVSTIMTPRADIVWLDVHDDYNALCDEVLRSPHSQFPVCDGDLDRFAGVILAKDFLRGSDKFNVREDLKPAIVVPEQTAALRAIEQMRQTTVHLALVVDGHGSVSGLLTTADILEALVGDLPPDRSQS